MATLVLFFLLIFQVIYLNLLRTFLSIYVVKKNITNSTPAFLFPFVLESYICCPFFPLNLFKNTLVTTHQR